MSIFRRRPKPTPILPHCWHGDGTDFIAGKDVYKYKCCYCPSFCTRSWRYVVDPNHGPNNPTKNIEWFDEGGRDVCGRNA